MLLMSGWCCHTVFRVPAKVSLACHETGLGAAFQLVHRILKRSNHKGLVFENHSPSSDSHTFIITRVSGLWSVRSDRESRVSSFKQLCLLPDLSSIKMPILSPTFFSRIGLRAPTNDKVVTSFAGVKRGQIYLVNCIFNGAICTSPTS